MQKLGHSVRAVQGIDKATFGVLYSSGCAAIGRMAFSQKGAKKRFTWILVGQVWPKGMFLCCMIR